jgi:type IV pilus assembly protein PilC
MKYYYKGVTRQREQVTGVVDAADEVEAQMKLRAMQIRPISLAENKAAATFSFSLEGMANFSLGPPVDLKGMLVFTRQFSSLIDSGIPVVQALDILWEQERRPAFKRILGRVKADIEGGQGLAEALKRHPKCFNEFFVRIVESGEISGTLDQALRRIGIQLEKLGRLRAKVVGAMIYPCITVVVASGVLIFLLVKVIPEITKLYTESSAKLPELTQLVLDISEWFQLNWGYVVGAGLSSIIGFIFAYKMPAFRAVWDPFIIRVPLFGPLIKKAEVARFTRTMATLIGTGVPLLNAFDICEKLMSNLTVKESVRNAAAYVQEGKSIAAGLKANGIFPPMVTHMVGIGEMTGKLDELLGKVSDIYDEEVDDAIGNLTGLIQPALIIVVGVLIAFMMMAMYMPIFQLADKVTGAM